MSGSDPSRCWCNHCKGRSGVHGEEAVVFYRKQCEAALRMVRPGSGGAAAHEVVIRLGRPSGIHTPDGSFLAAVREITVPFADRESAEAAQRAVAVHVRPVHDAGGEDYRPVVAGEVVGPAAEITDGNTGAG